MGYTANIGIRPALDSSGRGVALDVEVYNDGTLVLGQPPEEDLEHNPTLIALQVMLMAFQMGMNAPDPLPEPDTNV